MKEKKINIAICISGQLRSFSKSFHTLRDNIINPLEKMDNVDKVNIFMNCFKFNDENFYSNKYTSKMELDTPGWEEILEDPLFIYKNTYKFTDSNVYDIFNQYTNKNPDDMEKYQKNDSKEKNRSWKLLINAVCMHHNNKVIIDKVPDNYDIIIRLRCEGMYKNDFPINIISKCLKYDVIYFCTKNIKNLSNRGDNFFIGNTKTIKKLYNNIPVDDFLNEFIITGKLLAETMLLKLVKLNKIEPKSFHMNWKVSRNIYDSHKYK